MESFSNALNTAIRHIATTDEFAAKALRAQKVKEMWRDVVDPVFLKHTNSVYIINKDQVKTLIVYVDDSTFAAELNARRELIKLKLLQRFNEDIQDFQIKISWGKYKEQHLFQDDKESYNPISQPSRVLTPSELKELEKMVEDVPNIAVRESLLKAMISDYEYKTIS